MSYLVDTNILLRSVQPSHPMHVDAAGAVGKLSTQGEQLLIVPQNLIEFWAVATRPTESNGLGLSVDEAARELVRLKSLFPLLHDTAAIFPEWEGLVSRHQVKGKEAHDARIVASMLAHKVTHLLTFNTDDFKRYSQITAVNPRDV
ncbi:MAG: PIN domain-containing protein [Acidobacteria bacterium]|nr:PIN domain-containing protein [Acidobacteriota bacterium]